MFTMYVVKRKRQCCRETFARQLKSPPLDGAASEIQRLRSGWLHFSKFFETFRAVVCYIQLYISAV